MIKIADKSHCCACMACAQICPKACIDIVEDEEGFLYPKVNQTECINCGLCESVCQFLSNNENAHPIQIYASKNKNDTERLKSSSGGIFSILANNVLEKNGVVFGARFDTDFSVVHDFIEKKEDLNKLVGSKYLQSKVMDSFRNVKKFLQDDRIVLFSGTPCQILGLKKFLKRDYENLFCVDVVCHGAPSPKIWKEYLKTEGLCASKNISFRDKSSGWKNYSISFKSDKKTLLSQIFHKNLYMRGFLRDLYLRPSCYNCAAKNGKSQSDITLGDFWGVQHILPNFDDDKGVSLVLINTEKGKLLFDNTNTNNIEVSYANVLQHNRAIEDSAIRPPNREKFWKLYQEIGLKKAIQSETKIPLVKRIKNDIGLYGRICIRRLFGDTLYNKLKLRLKK